MRLSVLAPLCSALVLVGCVELSQETCEQGDWLAIGQQDGAKGRDANFVENHVESCGRHNIAVDRELWEQGRERGLVLFCTPQSQYEEGRSGRSFKLVCSIDDPQVLRAAYDKGRKYFELTRRIDRLEAELRSLRREANDPEANPFAYLDALHTRMEIDRLLRERRQYAAL